jgi:hypothetical protein
MEGLVSPVANRNEVEAKNVCIQDIVDVVVKIHEFTLKAELHNEPSVLKNVKPMVDELIEVAKMFKVRCDIERR